MPLRMSADPVAEILRKSDDSHIRLPLWKFSPRVRKAVLHERRVRFGEPLEDEDLGET